MPPHNVYILVWLPLPESILPLSIPGNRLDHSVLRHLPQKRRTSCRLQSKYPLNIRSPEGVPRGQSLLQCPDMGSRLSCKRCFNVRFFRANVRFFCVNVRFFRFLEYSAYVQCPVMKRMILIQQKISQESLKVLRGFMNAVFQIIIICPDQ